MLDNKATKFLNSFIDKDGTSEIPKLNLLLKKYIWFYNHKLVAITPS